MLTGAARHVANYPGTTVEVEEGHCRHNDLRINVVDLPGAYGLTTFSAEELVARNFIIDEKPDVVVNVIDTSNMERNLYLTTQLIELGVPIVLAFNMSDVAEQRGIVLILPGFPSFSKPPLFAPSQANRRAGLIYSTLLSPKSNTPRKPRTHHITYGDEIENAIKQIEPLVRSEYPGLAAKYDPRWLALKLLEQDSDILSKISG